MGVTLDQVILSMSAVGINNIPNAYNRSAGAAARYERAVGLAVTANDKAVASAQRWTAVGAIATTALLSVAKASLTAAGQVQRVETGFRTVLKNEAAVRKLSADVRAYDLESQFDYLTVAKSSQQLLAAGFRKDLLPTLYAVGNALGATGKGSAEAARAFAIFSKIKTEGVLKAVRINQFTGIGINAKAILKKQLGLTDDQMLDIGRLRLKADVVLPALIKGFNEDFAGGMKKQAKGYIGSLETMGGARDKFYATLGKAISPDVVAGIQLITRMTTAASNFAAVHPRLTKAAFAVTALGSAFAVYKGITSTFRTLRNVSLAAALAKDVLAASTIAETRAEAAKIPVGTAESAMHTAGARAALVHAGANNALALTGGNPLVGGAGKAGALGKFAQWGSKGLFSANLLSKLPLGLGAQLSAATNGSALAGGAVALGSGYMARKSFADAGYTPGQSTAAGIGTTLAVGALTLLAPEAILPAAAALAVASAIKYGFDKYKFEREDNLAEAGTGMDAAGTNAVTVARKSHDYASQAAIYLAKSQQASANGDPIMAASWRESANKARQDEQIYKRKDARTGLSEYDRRNDAENKANLAIAIKEGEMRRQRNGSYTITLPETNGDAFKRQEEYRARTARLR